MEKNRLLQNRACLFFLLVSLACMGIAAGLQADVPAHYQHIYLPPALEQGDDETKIPTNTHLLTAWHSAKAVKTQLADVCAQTTFYGLSEPCLVSVPSASYPTSADASALLIESSYDALRPLVLKHGRLFYPEEYSRAERVVLLDEMLAVALFQYADPLQEKVEIAGESYRIVGIVKDHKQVGDLLEYHLYLPYQSAQESTLPVHALIFEAQQSAGGWSAFEAATSSLGERGTTISLVKEKMNALLPMRFVLVVLGAMFCLSLVRLLNRRTLGVYQRIRALLQERYASTLLWYGLWRGVLLLCGYGLCILLLSKLFVLFIEPVYTFPEWIPTILVEPQDIADAFWNVWQTPAIFFSLRTADLLRLQFVREVMQWASILFALSAGVLYARIVPLHKNHPIHDNESLTL